MNTAQLLSGSSALFGELPLIRFEQRAVTFDDVFAQARRLADALRQRGVAPGDRVLLLAANKPEWIVSMLAILGAGAVAVPVNPALTAVEIAYVVEHCAPSLMLVDAALLEAVADAPGVPMIAFGDRRSGDWADVCREGDPTTDFADSRQDDPAVLFYTSGTTGRPKGVLLSHRNVVAVTELAIGHLLPPVVAGETGGSLVCGSLSFIYTIITNSFSCIRTGRTIVLQERFHPEKAMRAIERERVTVFMGVPTMFTMLLNWSLHEQVDASSLCFCISSGQNLPWSVAERFEARFGLPVYDFWGQTEGTPITGYDPLTERRVRPDSCGRALPGCGVRVIDDAGVDLRAGSTGEVLLAGPSVMLGYFRNEAATAETLRDGWVHTGDLGRLDADGYLFIVGRKRDLIIRGGANIYPVEIEEALYAFPTILECAVVGTPDALYGEVATAYVVLRPGESATDDALRLHCRQRLAEYKVPATFERIDALPKGPTGKILKRLLQDRQGTAVALQASA